MFMEDSSRLAAISGPVYAPQSRGAKGFLAFGEDLRDFFAVVITGQKSVITNPAALELR
ncbi:hypothetical protein [Alloyangia pacifica]|uniref:hypothetical protein n=1 Tax=Alloyangia pacifica TaxID=311180 RepID=UPI0031D0A57E